MHDLTVKLKAYLTGNLFVEQKGLILLRKDSVI